MKHYVRTAHGDLETYYSGSNERPLQGGGQGNGAAGSMWIAIGIILLDIIATVPINATLISAITLTTLTLSAIMYVDDTDILFTAKNGESIHDVQQDAQMIIRKWCDMLWISGGCLRPNKCWWYAIDFKWKNDGTWRYSKIADVDGTLKIPDHERIDQEVVQKEPHEGLKGLGVLLYPDGDDSDQFEELMGKVRTWSSHISKGFIS